MKRLFPLIVLVLSGIVSAQTTGNAVPTYSINDKLIGLQNLSGDGLKDCSIRSIAGKVRAIDVEGKTAEVKIKIDKKTTETVFIPLDRVTDEDRKPLFRHLITKNNVIRVSGYACDAAAPFSAFSVDRVY